LEHNLVSARKEMVLTTANVIDGYKEVHTFDWSVYCNFFGQFVTAVAAENMLLFVFHVTTLS
jgi:hypothetical protein